VADSEGQIAIPRKAYPSNTVFLRGNILLWLTLFSSFVRFKERLILQNQFEGRLMTTLVKRFICGMFVKW